MGAFCALCFSAAFVSIVSLDFSPGPDIKGKLTNACGLGGLFKHHSRLL